MSLYVYGSGEAQEMVLWEICWVVVGVATILWLTHGQQLGLQLPYLPLGPVMRSPGYLLEQLTAPRKTRSPVYYIIKNMIKVTDEQQHEEIHRVRSARVPSTGTSVLVGIGVCHPPNSWMCSPTQNLSEPHTIGILWKFHQEGMIDH